MARLAVHDHAVHVEDDCLELSHTRVWTIQGAGVEGTLKHALAFGQTTNIDVAQFPVMG